MWFGHTSRVALFIFFLYSKYVSASLVTFGAPNSEYSQDHKALESIGKVGSHNARVQRWLEFFTAFDYTLECRKGSANGNADFLSRLPEPTTEHDRNGSTSLTPVEDGGIYLIRACGLYTPSSLIPGVGLGGLMPRTENNALAGLPLTLADFCYFRTRGPRMYEA